MQTYFLKDEDLLRFYSWIAQEFQLYVPVELKSKLSVKCDYVFALPVDDYFLKPYPEVKKEEIVFNAYRCIEPARTYFSPPKENLGNYFKDAQSQNNAKPLAICGLKNCDIFSLKIQDFVFLGGNEPDSFYQSRRGNALIISSDCPNFKEACFCRAFDINPHVSEGFDFNLSPLNDGYLLDIGSAKAENITATMRKILIPATAAQASAREQKRESVIKRLEGHLSHHKIPKKETLKEIVVSGYDSLVWQEQMLNCVECGGCVFMCDTCHCFLLADRPESENAKRIRIWDGCLYKNFAKVAGGANPLKMRYMRLRNRYLKKFDFFMDNLGFQACCGCGRCIEVCPGKIDIRYILRKLYEEKYLSAR